MTQKQKTKTLAIIGCGPRGLNALENVLIEYTKGKYNFDLNVLVFERTGLFGCGQVYAPMQTEHNWMNLSERSLVIEEREPIALRDVTIPVFPSYHDWNNCDFSDESKPDIYPVRAEVGRYLQARFNSIAIALENSNLLTTFSVRIEKLEYNGYDFKLFDEDDNTYVADDIIITVGHQPTQLSEQISNWQNKASKFDDLTLIERAYPLRDLNKEIRLNNYTTIAIRGFGLAMIDIARAIAGFTDSQFEIIDSKTLEMRFLPSSTFPKRLIPFSLDGLPMHPKPINKKVDNWFMPKEERLEHLSKCLLDTLKHPERITSLYFLKSEMANVIVEQFSKLKNKAIGHTHTHNELRAMVIRYFEDKKIDSYLIVSKELALEQQLEGYCKMASGTGKISLDYCIGQVWRHCHPTLYKCLSFTGMCSEMISELIQLDEKLKRLTFGPPLESMQQLLAMVRAKKLTIKVIEDPDIVVTDKGWSLEEGNVDFLASVMINSVLDGTSVEKVETSLIKHLLQYGYVKPIHSKYGVLTYANGIVKPKSEKLELPLALLGRLAQGTLLGVDAILECFGIRSKNWAKGTIARLDK